MVGDMVGAFVGLSLGPSKAEFENLLVLVLCVSDRSEAPALFWDAVSDMTTNDNNKKSVHHTQAVAAKRLLILKREKEKV
mmetsp:Transcript_39227/g.77122  ORF Transcript_39227/g.77122 Transcript_39227/m.77122 type:complete len:80 (-) Transcript_39227:9-248(-)